MTIRPQQTITGLREPQWWQSDLGVATSEVDIRDFSNWKDHDSYQTAFQRLVKDLKAERRCRWWRVGVRAKT